MCVIPSVPSQISFLFKISAMENKYHTLQTIYELVKNDAHPTSSVVHPNEIIVRQNFPWDESVKHLDELKSENLVDILQLSPAVIFITDKGFQYILAARTKSRNSRNAA
jgi:predicted transcriptional regulator